MTWRELLDNIPEDQRDTDVTIHIPSMDEYFPLDKIGYSPYDDVLDEGHPFLVVKE
jgi:hypothetical protein